MGNYTLKMVVVGDAATGKDSIIQKFINMPFKKAPHFASFDMYAKDINLGQDEVVLSIWKIAGHDRFKFFRSDFYKGAIGAMIVFDLTQYSTFNPSVVNWIREVWLVTGRIPIILVGNKSELNNKRKIHSNEAKAYADKIPCNYIETSAQNGKNIKECFLILTKQMLGYYKKYLDLPRI